ncbi:SGNH/GDSL hydrolase family protein [Spirosoma sp. HMF3257]|uniref:SGNH/GDSL hydrolase family protein n=1 Tax=Spirosoma telluris TaxID=2183553 RepID=A0A327NQK0_9BACT|nr:SGNH/GDSL hydrolase family protein [Spirosoma telluris]RAI77562.1 SGNH/GDSL hydrolase family protein [Spirosoma telluris]
MGSKLVSSAVRLLLLGFIAFLFYYGDRLHVGFDYPHKGLFDNVYVRLAKGCILVLIVIELLRCYYYGVVKNPKPPKLLGNIATLIVPIVGLLVTIEIVFMCISQSQEGGLTLASHIWFERYWPPMVGDYRDTPKVDTVGKKNVFVLGDSFTSGHGLKSADERYGNILAEKLGTKEYVTYNLGISGSDTRDEYARLVKFGKKPDVLILQYFPNDIEKVARDHGLVPAGFEPYSDLPRAVQSLFIKSYLLNYLYWQFPHGNFAPFDTYARTAYGTPAIINDHLSDLNKFITYAQENNCRFYVVMFPFSHNIEKTAVYVKPVVDFFQRNNVPILNVGTLMGDIAPNDRVVGRNDGHASALVNQRVGDALFRLMQSNPGTSQMPSANKQLNAN